MPFVKGTSASTASRSASVTIASAPLWSETGEVLKVICPTAKAKYFFRSDWTASEVICPSGRLLALRDAFEREIELSI
jgi:hypothetical protein